MSDHCFGKKCSLDRGNIWANIRECQFWYTKPTAKFEEKIQVLPKCWDLHWIYCEMRHTYPKPTWKISWKRSSIFPTLLKVALMLEYLRFRPAPLPCHCKDGPVICHSPFPPPSGSQQCRHPTKGWALVFSGNSASMLPQTQGFEGTRIAILCVLTTLVRAQEKKEFSKSHEVQVQSNEEQGCDPEIAPVFLLQTRLNKSALCWLDSFSPGNISMNCSGSNQGSLSEAASAISSPTSLIFLSSCRWSTPSEN